MHVKYELRRLEVSEQLDRKKVHLNDVDQTAEDFDERAPEEDTVPAWKSLRTFEEKAFASVSRERARDGGRPGYWRDPHYSSSKPLWRII